MHDYYFIGTAFGSDSDTKIEYRNLWQDSIYQKKYLSKINEIMCSELNNKQQLVYSLIL